MSRRVTKSADRRLDARKAARLSQSGRATSAVSGDTEEMLLEVELFALSFTMRRRALNVALARQGGARIVDARPTPNVDPDSRSPVSSEPGMAPREGEISAPPQTALESRSIDPRRQVDDD